MSSKVLPGQFAAFVIGLDEGGHNFVVGIMGDKEMMKPHSEIGWFKSEGIAWAVARSLNRDKAMLDGQIGGTP